MTTQANDNNQESWAQRRQAEQNAKRDRKQTETPADKKLDGPNRPSV
jgi:hypothetical protein